MEYIIYTDGGSRGNPGQAAIGGIIYADEVEVDRFSEKIGVATNNIAEYSAVLLAVNKLLPKIKKEDEIKFYLDSQLVARQLGGQYKIKDLNLAEKAGQIFNLIASYNLKISFIDIPREKNVLADKLVNKALDSK